MSNICGYVAEPLSRKDIRQLSYKFRKIFELENELFFPIVNVIEYLHNKGGDCFRDMYY